MGQAVENLTRPGAKPEKGDRIKVMYSNGASVMKSYSPPEDADPLPRYISASEFIDRFTSAELSGIWRLAETDPETHGFIVWLGSQSRIDLDSQRVMDGMDAAVAGGKIKRARANAVIA